MKYIYILQSVKTPDQYYSGSTDNLEQILTKHNGRQITETAKYAPWNLHNYIAFADEAKARAFDHFLKSDEGLTFIKRRL